jgi:hypothetical protein
MHFTSRGVKVFPDTGILQQVRDKRFNENIISHTQFPDVLLAAAFPNTAKVSRCVYRTLRSCNT